MAIINKYKVSDDGSIYDVTLSDTVHSSEKNGELYGFIDFEKATKGEILAFRQGWVDRTTNDKNFAQTNQQQNQMLGDMFDNYGSELPNSQNRQENKGKVLNLNNGHSILGNDDMGGFTNRLLISLLAGVGIGVATAAVYIFLGLSKVTVNFM